MRQDAARTPIRSISILYEDSYYVVFDKPSGLLVIPTPQNEQNTLVNIVNAQCVRTSGEGKLHPCHRLDRDTSGVIVFAKGKRCQRLMMDIFRRQEIKKRYIAFVHGRLERREGILKSRIQDLDQKKYYKLFKGKTALTHYKVLQQKKKFSIVEARPVTGRTNQIRIQFSEIGHPLVGERKYAVARDFPLKFRRVALHAYTVEWRHPVTKEMIKVTAKLPQDMEAFSARNGN